MFIGDRTNDIVALAQADTGVSVSSGMDVAIGAVDVIMLADPANIHKNIDTIFKISENSFRRIAWNNSMWSFVYNWRSHSMLMRSWSLWYNPSSGTGRNDFDHSGGFGRSDYGFPSSSSRWKVGVDMEFDIGGKFPSLCGPKVDTVKIV